MQQQFLKNIKYKRQTIDDFLLRREMPYDLLTPEEDDAIVDAFVEMLQEKNILYRSSKKELHKGSYKKELHELYVRLNLTDEDNVLSVLTFIYDHLNEKSSSDRCFQSHGSYGSEDRNIEMNFDDVSSCDLVRFYRSIIEALNVSKYVEKRYVIEETTA